MVLNDKNTRLLNWTMQNYMMTIDQLPANIVAELLQLARVNALAFNHIMTKGLALRLHHLHGRAEVPGKSLPVFFTESRLKLAVAHLCVGSEVPAVPLCSMSFLDPAENKALSEIQILAFDKGTHVGGRVISHGGCA